MRRRLLAFPVPAAALGVALGALLSSACRPSPRPAGDELAVPVLDPAALDRTIAPCDDFYAFACGGWIASTPVPPDRVAFSRAAGELEERNTRALRRLLEEARSARGDRGERGEKDRALRKAGDLYAACMDEAGVEARGLADLLAEWAEIDAVQDRGGLAAALARLEAAGIEAPFALDAASPGGAGAPVELVLAPGGLALPAAEYLDPAAEPARRRYAQHLEAMLGLAGVPAAEAAGQAGAVLDLERALAGGAAAAPAPERVDRAGLQRLAPAFPWPLLFAGLGLAWPERTALPDPAFVARAADLFQAAPLPSWKAYLRWRVTDALAAARALPTRMVDERFRFRAAALGGPPYQHPRWKDCAARTAEALGPAVGEALARRLLQPVPERRDRAVREAAELSRALEARLATLAWMDEPTRARARERVARLTLRAGGPEAAREDAALRVGRESYFRSVLSAGRRALLRRLEAVGRPAEREWPIAAQAVAVWLDPDQGALYLPAGVLQPPFFGADLPDELRLGAGGTAIGAALVPLLDAGAVRPDAEGAAAGWWTPRTAEQHAAVAACLAREAGDGVAGPDAAHVAAEELAERGGVRLAWTALQAARAGHPPGRKLLGFTPDQQFFLAYAQSRCTARREEDRAPGRPARARVNGALAATPEFAAAFACKEGAPMVRPAGARCGEW